MGGHRDDVRLLLNRAAAAGFVPFGAERVDDGLRAEPVRSGLLGTQTIASSINSEKLISLPGNVRAANDTSPYNLIALLPGVQPDSSWDVLLCNPESDLCVPSPPL